MKAKRESNAITKIPSITINNTITIVINITIYN